MICPACGSRNPDTERFCGTCGSLLSDVPETQLGYEREDMLKSRPVAPRRKTATLAIVSLVLGLLALTPLTLLAGIPAVILAIVALRQRRPGRSMALTGLVAGAFGTLVLTFVLPARLTAWQRELHRVAVVEQNMRAYQAAMIDYATANNGSYPKSGISWEKEDEDGMVLHFKTPDGLLSGIPFNPYTHERYRKGKDFFYLPEYLAETEQNGLVSRADPGSPFAQLAAPGGEPGTIVILGWTLPQERGSPLEYAIVGYGRKTIEPLAVPGGRTFFVLHN